MVRFEGCFNCGLHTGATWRALSGPEVCSPPSPGFWGLKTLSGDSRVRLKENMAVKVQKGNA